MSAAFARRTDLPPLIARYVERNLLPGDTASRVRFGQVGELQLKPGGWARFEAEQEVSVTRVEFSWHARFPLAPLVALHVRDWYRAGEGALEVRLWGLPFKRLRGDSVAKGEAIRYLAELPWAPQAMFDNRELEWREVDERTVEVATSVGGERVAVLLHFDAAGDIAAASAEDPCRRQERRCDSVRGRIRRLRGVCWSARANDGRGPLGSARRAVRLLSRPAHRGRRRIARSPLSPVENCGLSASKFSASHDR